MSAMEGEAEEELDRIVTGLVREWLFRKGLTDVLARFDDETDARSSSLSNTTALVSTLGLSTLYKRNLEQGRPLPSVLEVLTSHFVTNASTSVDCLVASEPTAAESSTGAGATTTILQPVIAQETPAQSTELSAASVKKGSFWDRLQQPTVAPEPSNPSLLAPAQAHAQAQEQRTLAPGAAPLPAQEDEPMRETGDAGAQGMPPASSAAAQGTGAIEEVKGADSALQVVMQASEEVTGPASTPPVDETSSTTVHMAEQSPETHAVSATVQASASPHPAVATPPAAPAPPAPALPPAAPAVPVQTKKLGFFERMAAAQAEKAKAASTAAQPSGTPSAAASAAAVQSDDVSAPPMSAQHSTPPESPAPVHTVPAQAQSQAPLVAPVVPAPPAPALGSKFAARLAAQAQQQQAPGPAVPQHPVPAPVAPAAAPVDAAPKGKGGFWDRVNSGKGATPSTTPAAPLPTVPTYTAPDGRTFTDKNEYRRHVFTTFYTFAGQTGAQLTKGPGQIAGQPFNLEHLTDCTVILADTSDTVQVDYLRNCRVLIAASCESVFLRNCTGCTFTIACKQLRTRDCQACTVYLYSKTEPVIEASAGMRFAPFNAAYAGLDVHMKAAALEPTRNYWDRIFDFSKDTNSIDLPLPHWTLLPEQECTEWRIEGLPGALPGPPVNPVPRASQDPAMEHAQGSGMLSFDIRAGMQVAQAALDEQEGMDEDG